MLTSRRVRVIERALEELKGAQHRSDQKMDLILEAIRDQTKRGGKRQRESAAVVTAVPAAASAAAASAATAPATVSAIPVPK